MNKLEEENMCMYAHVCTPPQKKNPVRVCFLALRSFLPVTLRTHLVCV